MTEAALLQACRTLFGQDINLNRDFLLYLQPSGAKLAYRNQAKVNHPDRFNDSPSHVREQQSERFREIHEAYKLLKNFFDKKHVYRFDVKRPANNRNSPVTRPKPAQPRTRRPSRSRHSRIPAIPLEFGMFAYYQGKISYQDLIGALVWQRKQRPVLGAIASRWGWLTEQQVRKVLEFRGHSPRFGKKAVELGLLTQLQVNSLVHHQRNLQRKIGEYFVGKGLMTSAETDQLANQLHAHNSKLLGKARQTKSR